METTGWASGSICTRLQRINPTMVPLAFCPNRRRTAFQVGNWALYASAPAPTGMACGMCTHFLQYRRLQRINTVDLVNSCIWRFWFRNVHAMWTEDHALAWHLEEKFRQNSAAWALDKCLAWDQLENKLPNFTSEVIDCPCTLAQARADTGRFHVSVKSAGHNI